MTISSFADLSAKLGRLSTELPKATSKGVDEAALILQAAVAVAAGRNAGKPIARTKVYLRPGQPTALVAMTSRKAHLLDHDTKGADILPGAVTGRRGRKAALFIPGSEHPIGGTHRGPTTGNLMWEKGVEAARPKIAQVVADTIPTAILGAFGG